jgi:hypothetical protein
LWLPGRAEFAEEFFVSPDFGGKGLQGELLAGELLSEPGQGCRVVCPGAVFFDDGAQCLVAVEATRGMPERLATVTQVTGSPAAASSAQACSTAWIRALLILPAPGR